MPYNNNYFTGFGWVTIKLKNKWEDTQFYVGIYLNYTNKIFTDESKDYTSVYSVRIWKASTKIRIVTQGQLGATPTGDLQGTVDDLMSYEHHTLYTKDHNEERKEVPHKTPEDLPWQKDSYCDDHHSDNNVK